VALLLQIGDLHLGPLGRTQAIGDNKDQFIPVVERQNRIQVLRTSLRALASVVTANDRVLDAVVVAGDVSSQYSETGFEILADLLAQLGQVYPGDDRVVVVPGNHDVKWKTPASSAERYELFLSHIRRRGFVTPYLEGTDLDATGKVIGDPAFSPILTLDDGAVAIAAMNSANYSGSVEPTALDAGILNSLSEKAASDPAIASLLAEVDRLSLRDAARVSPAQLTALRSAFDTQREDAVRAVVLHHHLLPVTLNEEVKAYESIVNLGEVREFLTTNRIHLVMHGHKHSASTYLDLTHRPQELEIGRTEFVQQQPVMVSSVASVGTALGAGSEVARLVEISPQYPRARRVSAFGVPGLASGSSYRDLDFPRVASTVVRFDDDPGRVHLFEGTTVDDVYEQLLTVFDDARAPAAALMSVVCRISDGSSALDAPASYGSIFAEPPSDWFEEIVDWWQDPDPVLAPGRFNHGSRIFRGFGELDQIESVVEALEADPTTTRGVVILIDPSTDEVGNNRARLPAFAFAHFVVDKDARRLDCIGYFRKQQMRVWWPINACELARLQREVLRRLHDRGRDFFTGSIVTVSAEALAGTDRPRVLVPWIDRIAAEDVGKVWELALDLFEPSPPPEDGPRDPLDYVLAAWRRVFGDWLPTGVKEPDGVPVSLTGLALLEQAVRVLGTRYDDGEAIQLADHLSSLHYDNERYSESEDLPRLDSAQRNRAYDKWVRQVAREYEAIMAIVEKVVARWASSDGQAGKKRSK
jgi:3',5'-cyclic AMP phosphodiesterase CpdA